MREFKAGARMRNSLMVTLKPRTLPAATDLQTGRSGRLSNILGLKKTNRITTRTITAWVQTARSETCFSGGIRLKNFTARDTHDPNISDEQFKKTLQINAPDKQIKRNHECNSGKAK
jgi:hypothetical protein